jgi:dGTPase
MQWDELICSERFKSKSEPKSWSEYPISEYEKDYAEIAASSAFRRLQDKTQVFPLDKSDFVRTRLTHSVEVSTIAKQIGVKVLGYITEHYQVELTENEKQDIYSILMCAGLLHDVGNPPFGYFGETVIGDWFKRYFENNKAIAKRLLLQMKNDLKHFEGNAQTLRILMKNSKTKNNINLTFAVIQALMKYPTNSNNFNKKNSDVKKHKNGFLLSERDSVNKVVQATNSIVGTEIARHPLTFILEAADQKLSRKSSRFFAERWKLSSRACPLTTRS